MKSVLIVGGSSGIGLETGRLFAKNGDKVYNASRTPAPDSAIENITCDVTRPGDIEIAVGKMTDVTGVIDTLVYSAGYSMAAPIEFVKEEDYRYLFETNFFGALKCIRTIVPFMKGGGRMMFVSSIGGTVPIPFDSYYSASKAALDMLIRDANIELNEYGIYLTTVKVGGTCTRFTFKRNVYPEREVGAYGEKMNKAAVALANIEQGGMRPEEVAQAIFHAAEHSTSPVLTVGALNKTYTLTERFLPAGWTNVLTKFQFLQ